MVLKPKTYFSTFHPFPKAPLKKEILVVTESDRAENASKS